MPFGKAAQELSHFTGVRVSEATARRITEQAGADYVAVQSEQVQQIQQHLPPAAAGPARQLLSVDGAFVPLVHKQWAEVKTLAVGVVKEPCREAGKVVTHTEELSYFSRSSEAPEFTAEALVELHRRGTETAQQVIAVTDGAPWEQSFIDYHRPDAVRILDFAHASEYLAEAGRSLYGDETEQFQGWFRAAVQQLKRGRPPQGLKPLRQLERSAQAQNRREALETIQSSRAYLEKRLAMIDYARFQALGYPIGSGSVESAHKVVVQSRMKQAGMHWQRSHVDPMVALRNIACNDRWPEAWPQILAHQQQTAEDSRGKRPQRERCARGKAPVRAALGVLPPARVDSAASVRAPLGPTPQAAKPVRAKAIHPHRPAADHPWRRMPIGRARYRPSVERPGAKS